MSNPAFVHSYILTPTFVLGPLFQFILEIRRGWGIFAPNFSVEIDLLFSDKKMLDYEYVVEGILMLIRKLHIKY